ncbi:MAG: hypothetical protein WC765_06135 [Phycisphaerae bacterium]|jgi:hypothetical protein
MNPGIAFYEQILQRTVLEPNSWSGGADYSLFKQGDSLHTFTQAYGRPHARYVCWCVSPVSSHFVLDDVRNESDRQSRYLLKIVAAWRDWRKHAHPVQITVNGEVVYDGPFFLENVLAGWPAQYIQLPPKVLRNGRNEITITSGSGEENILLLAGVEILRQPDLIDFTVHAAPEAVAAGEIFWVQLHLLGDHPDIHVQAPPGKIEFMGRDGELFRFRATGIGENLPIHFASGTKTCEAVIDRIGRVRKADRVPVWIGLDGDDIRHDMTGEMDRVLDHFIYSGVGNYLGFRTQLGRNFCCEQRPTHDQWRRWVRQCREHGVFMHYSGNKEYLDGLDFTAEAGAHFSGYQFHEPYLVFQPNMAERFMTEKLKAAGNLLEKKEAYLDYLRARVESEKQGDTAVYSGEPSLTCIYSAESGVDGLLCEPVSNVSLLYGAARGTGKKFGAHIPADWYFGYPHDDTTLRRLQLAVWLAYAYGGQILYLESTVFKTNANDRNDWEDGYCRGARQILRDFHRFTQLDERVGKPFVPLAFVYGNLESMFWMDDDRIPETVDMGNWDRLHWGMPGTTEHRRVWNASEAWLPRVPLDEPRNESLTRMFTGTPYGPVDIVPPTAGLSCYQAVAFLGWNTMTEEIYANLLSFVKAGGTLFLCGCHLDTRIDLAAEPSPVFGGMVSELIGAEIEGPGAELLPGIRACALKPIAARQLDENFWIHESGPGKVYFGNFFDYPSDYALIDRITGLLKTIGENIRTASPFQVETPSPYIHYSVWEHQGKKKVYAMDADWRKTEGESLVTVRDGELVRTVTVEAGKITAVDIEVRKGKPPAEK